MTFFFGPNIASLPFRMDQMAKLEHLVVGATKLTTLPDSMRRMHNLKELDLFGCFDMETLPACVPHMAGLTDLNLASRRCPTRWRA